MNGDSVSQTRQSRYVCSSSSIVYVVLPTENVAEKGQRQDIDRWLWRYYGLSESAAAATAATDNIVRDGVEVSVLG